MSEFEIKDSGKRQEFASGMVRDSEAKTSYLNADFGPMPERIAVHLTKGREKYADPEPGIPNWALAAGIDEWLRARESARRHMKQWLEGFTDEDHAAAVYFNLNVKEYVEGRMSEEDLLQARRIERFHREGQLDPLSPEEQLRRAMEADAAEEEEIRQELSREGEEVWNGPEVSVVVSTLPQMPEGKPVLEYNPSCWLCRQLRYHEKHYETVEAFASDRAREVAEDASEDKDPS